MVGGLVFIGQGTGNFMMLDYDIIAYLAEQPRLKATKPLILISTMNIDHKRICERRQKQPLKGCFMKPYSNPSNRSGSSTKDLSTTIITILCCVGLTEGQGGQVARMPGGLQDEIAKYPGRPMRLGTRIQGKPRNQVAKEPGGQGALRP
jgi:hypothetical protein